MWDLGYLGRSRGGFGTRNEGIWAGLRGYETWPWGSPYGVIEADVVRVQQIESWIVHEAILARTFVDVKRSAQRLCTKDTEGHNCTCCGP